MFSSSPMHGGRLLSLFCSSFPKDSWFMPKQVTPLSSHLLKKPQSIFRRNRLAASRGFELSKTLKNCRLYKCKPKVLSKLPNRAGTYVLTLPRQGYLEVGLAEDWEKGHCELVVDFLWGTITKQGFLKCDWFTHRLYVVCFTLGGWG